MAKKSTDFWNRHSINYLEMALGENKNEIITDPDGYAKRHHRCGDSIEFFIVGSNDYLEFVSYHAEGCMNTEACANTVAHFACGKSLLQARKITKEQVIEYLETLPSGEWHCADMAVQTLHEALDDFVKNRKSANS